MIALNLVHVEGQMTIEELLIRDDLNTLASGDFKSPFVTGALVEGIVAWYKHDVARNSLAVVIDLGNSLFYDFDGIGLLRVSDIEHIRWNLPRSGSPHAVIGCWEVQASDSASAIGIGFCGSATLEVRYRSAVFILCHCGDDPPLLSSACEPVGVIEQ